MHDLTKGHPIKVLILFTIPLLIGNLFQQIYSMSDTIIVGQTLGVNALAAVGSTSSISFLIIGFAQGLTVGLSLVIAKYFGAKDYLSLKRSFITSTIISIIAAISLMALSLTYIDKILMLMHTPDIIFEDAKTYITIIFWGLPQIVLFNLFSNVLRAIGDSKTPLIFLAISSITNIVLALIFIKVFNMGIFGAGLATFLSYIFPVIQCILLIKKKYSILTLDKDETYLVSSKEYLTHIQMALPMAFQMSVIAIGIIILQATLNSLGTQAVAAESVAVKVDQFAIQPLASFGLAMATFTAQNYGARQYTRIMSGVKQALGISIGFGVIAGILIILLGKTIILAFVAPSEIEVINLTQQYFIIVESCYFLLAILFVLRNVLQGLGYGAITTIAGAAELLMRSFAAIILVKYLGFMGACLACPLAWLGSVIILVPGYIYAYKKLKVEHQELVLEQTQELEINNKYNPTYANA